MKKFLIALAILPLLQATAAEAATDWTPYLKPMMLGCNYPSPNDKLPKAYKASVTSKKKRVDNTNAIDGYGEEITTYYLKNSTAFGKPISKIEELRGYEWGHLKIYFKDSSFTALRPQFKLPNRNDPDHEGMIVEKNNATGYEIQDIGYTVLEFNTKEKSISCFSGL